MVTGQVKRGTRTSAETMAAVFDRGDRQAAAVTTVAALMLYSLTLAPTVTLDQSGAFATAADHWGVGRVPGYPLWHLLGHLFTRIFSWVTYRGHPNPAWATNFMSAVFGALTCGLVALLVSRVGRGLSLGGTRRSLAPAIAGVVAGVMTMFSPTLWSQAVITETHTLTTFCIVWFLTACLAWIMRPDGRRGVAVVTAYGLGLAQCHVMLLLAPSLLLCMALVRPRLCREFIIANALLWVAPVWLWAHGLAMPELAIAALSLIVLGIAVPLRLSADGRLALLFTGILAAGVAFYAYLPIASESNPPMQFGYARTWEGFCHVISRGQYERIVPAPVFSLRFLELLGWFAALLSRQFVVPLGAIALLPVIRITAFQGPLRRWWGVLLLSLFVLTFVMLAGANPRGDVQDTYIQRTRFIPAFALWGVLIGLGFTMLAAWSTREAHEAPSPPPPPA